jgi:emp24/gp25L/p24 family/GOLD
MRTFVLGMMLFAVLAGGIVGGWAAMNHYATGSVGTPAHAGALSNGHPEDCTNVNFQVKQRGVAIRKVMLQENTIVRGTFEANGGFGKVDIMMRIMTPQNLVLSTSPRAENYDFFFPVELSGEYQFVFDNRYSLFTAKAIGLYYCIDDGRR